MYSDLVANYSENPRDVHTVPTTQKTPLWFHVFVKNSGLRVKSSQLERKNNSKIKGSRELKAGEFDLMLDIYHRRCSGEKISKEATDATRNQVYWFGIFADMNL